MTTRLVGDISTTDKLGIGKTYLISRHSAFVRIWNFEDTDAQVRCYLGAYFVGIFR